MSILPDRDHGIIGTCENPNYEIGRTAWRWNHSCAESKLALSGKLVVDDVAMGRDAEELGRGSRREESAFDAIAEKILGVTDILSAQVKPRPGPPRAATVEYPLARIVKATDLICFSPR